MSTFNRIITSTLIACVCVASSMHTTPASANPNVNRDLKTALDRAGLNYSITENGDITLVYNLNGGRQQTVFILSESENLGNSMKTRRIFSSIPTFENGISQETKKQLLQHSNQKRIGSWIALSPKQFTFVAKVDANLSPEDLKTVTNWVAIVGDEMEQKLFGTDSY